MKNYIKFSAAKAWLQSQGFNGQDMECVLDLTSVRTSDGTAYCHEVHLKRLAARSSRFGLKENQPTP